MRVLIQHSGSDEFAVKPAVMLGYEGFQTYLHAVREAGLAFNGASKRHLGAMRLLPDTIKRLQLAGFSVEAEPSLKSALLTKISETDARYRNAEVEVQLREKLLAAGGGRFFPFQRTGVQWLLSRTRGALLGDDMGLGKTMQSLMAAPIEGRVLVICPAVVKRNWSNEVLRWRPDLIPMILSGRNSFRWPRQGEAIIVNYDALSGEVAEDGQSIVGLPDPPDGVHLIVDEAQACKSLSTKRGRLVSALCAHVRKFGGFTVGTTGTPIMNRPMELWNLLTVFGLAEEAFDSLQRFRRLYRFRYASDRGDPQPEAVELLRRVMLRRLKSEVLKDLPAKTRTDIDFEINASLRDALTALAEKLGLNLSSAMSDEDWKRLNSTAGFEEISRVRALLAQAAIPHVMQLVEECEESGEPVVVASAHRSPIDALAARPGWAVITGDQTPDERAAVVAKFQAGELRGVGLTIAAGGVGITLTAASKMIFADLAWTPAGNQQAEDRINRIGQKNACNYYRLVADHPLCHRVMELLDDKQALIESAVDAAAVPEAEVPAPDRALSQVNVHELFATVAAPRDEAVEVAALRIEFPAANYALENEPGAENPVSFYRVDRPTDGRWAGWSFVHQLIGGSSVRVGSVSPTGAVRGDGTRLASVVSRIAADPLVSAVMYGKLIGACAVCGCRLTNHASRDAGIGPICADKFGA